MDHPAGDDSRVSDRLEIRDLLSRYCRAVDRLDEVGLRAVFHPGATIDKGAVEVDRDEYVLDVMRRHALVPLTSHQVTNVLVDFVDDSTAVVESYGIAVERRPDTTNGDTDVVFRVRYGDVIDRRDGEWRIGRRRLVVDHVLKVAVPEGLDEITNGRFVAARSDQDPISQLRVETLAAGHSGSGLPRTIDARPRSAQVPEVEPYAATSRTILVDGLETHYLEAGSGPTLVLLHSGEFGSCAELSWEYCVARLSRRFRVVMPDWIGYGKSAKVHDFVDFAAFKLRHMSRFCEELGISDVPFIGNSMAANFLIRDAASGSPRIPASAFVALSGGGPVPKNEARAALVEYDCTKEGMRRLLGALFHDEVWSADDAYVTRRHELSLIPGSWECAAAARFHAPGAAPTALEKVRANELTYTNIRVPALLMAGSHDKLKPRGYAAELAAQIPGAEAVEVDGVGHCPQIEAPAATLDIILDFLDRRTTP